MFGDKQRVALSDDFTYAGMTFRKGSTGLVLGKSSAVTHQTFVSFDTYYNMAGRQGAWVPTRLLEGV